jgi:hypothetical protein
MSNLVYIKDRLHSPVGSGARNEFFGYSPFWYLERAYVPFWKEEEASTSLVFLTADFAEGRSGVRTISEGEQIFTLACSLRSAVTCVQSVGSGRKAFSFSSNSW